MKAPVRVAITGAAGQIGYALLNSYTIVFLFAGVINLLTGFEPLALAALVTTRRNKSCSTNYKI
mgnify:CR=1 FL=1